MERPYGTVVGRLAPSPTGGLHVGHARTFLAAWLSVRSQWGVVVLRVEDIKHKEDTQERLDKAAATQMVFEDALIHIIGDLIRRTGSDRLVLTGRTALNAIGMRDGSEATFGKGYNVLPIWKDRMDARTWVPTPNADVIYSMSYLDLKETGPLVVAAPANVGEIPPDARFVPLTVNLRLQAPGGQAMQLTTVRLVPRGNE